MQTKLTKAINGILIVKGLMTCLISERNFAVS